MTETIADTAVKPRPRATKAARSMKNYLRIRDSSDDDAGKPGFGTFLGIDLRERNFARIRAA